jgi:hypothetical protein
MVGLADKIATLAEYLKAELKVELVKQKHVATGDLLNSIDVRSREEAGIIIEGFAAVQGLYINKQQDPGKYRPIDALEEWAKVKGLQLKDGQTYRQVAYAISNSIAAKGLPAKPYSRWTEGNSLKRIEWIEDTLERTKTEIEKMITDAYYRSVQLSFEKSLKTKTQGGYDYDITLGITI